MLTVAITGAGGLVGRRLAAELAGREDVSRVLGLDVRGAEGIDAPEVTLRHVDVRDPGLSGHLDGVDVLVHLAAQLDPVRDEDVMASINVEGTRNVVRAAAEAGVAHVVHLSSAVVYGAHPDNDFPLTEASPLRPNADFSYAEQKAEADRWLAGEDLAPMTVTVLRPSIIAGRGVDNFISRLLESPRAAAVAGHKPPLQFVHLDDVVSAIVHAIDHRLDGAYNVSSEGWLSFDEFMAISGRRFAFLGEEVAFTAAARLWDLGIGEAPAGFVNYLMHPWVVSVEKLTATGWQPKRSNRDALVELVDDHRGYVSLGRVRTERRSVRRAMVATVATVTGLVAWRISRRED